MQHARYGNESQQTWVQHPQVAAPGAFSALVACCWHVPSPYAGAKATGALATHPTSFTGKASSSLKELYKTLDLMIAWSFPGLKPTNDHISHWIDTLGWHSGDGSCWKWVGGSGPGSRLGPPSCHISHHGTKKIPWFSLPNYGQETFATPGSAVSVLRLLITMQSMQNTGHPALLLHTWMVSIN